MLLTDEGQRRVAEIAQQRGFSTEATEGMLSALIHGNGSQAQFNHPEFGGMGQWSMGGMLMIGDMFNNGLKARVDGLAYELSGLIASVSLLQPQRASGDGMSTVTSIWPAELGSPSSSGAQNDMQYAIFPAQRRIAVMRAGRVYLYDTGDHIIGGISQQQGGGNSLLLSSQYGPVPLESLTPVSLADVSAPEQTLAEPQIDLPIDEPVPQPASVPASQIQPSVPMSQTSSPSAKEDGSIFSIIEQLHALHSRGILTQAEFEAKKAELLSRI